MKNKYRVDTIEHWTTEIEAESKVAAQELVNDGDEGAKRTLTMFTTENVWECTEKPIFVKAGDKHPALDPTEVYRRNNPKPKGNL